MLYHRTEYFKRQQLIGELITIMSIIALYIRLLNASAGNRPNL